MASNIESKSLKDQFDKLQRQQQEKLLKRKQKKEEKQPSSVKLEPDGKAFGIDDNLDLKVSLCDKRIIVTNSFTGSDTIRVCQK